MWFQSSTQIHQTPRIQKDPLWRAVSKLGRLGVWIHWFRVDGRPISIKKGCDFKSIQIHVDGT